jgi:chemotaxis protein methyltransferase CheR
LIYKRFGIDLGDQKRALVVGRLNKVLRKLGFTNFKDYYKYLMRDRSGQALDTLINRISTNHTFFNRESDHFEYFREVALPHICEILKNSGRTDLRIWCPGCSTGEEPYMLAILLNEFFDTQISLWNPRLLATDISNRVLEIARSGVYNRENISHLTPGLRNKYFQKHLDNTWVATDQIKNLILFRRLNLMRETYPFRGKFHVIFCRNVMIYFDQSTRDSLVARLSRYIEDDGYLFVGHSESLGRNNQYFQYIKPAVYRKLKITKMGQ